MTIPLTGWIRDDGTAVDPMMVKLERENYEADIKEGWIEEDTLFSEYCMWNRKEPQQ